MPQIPFTLAWSSKANIYEIYRTQDHKPLLITLDSPAWFTWLEHTTSFFFFGKYGHYILHKNTQTSAEGYWHAYCCQHNHVRKSSVASTQNLFISRLDSLGKDVLRPTQSLTAPMLMHKEKAPSPPLPSPLIRTKLYAPTPVSPLISRTRLIEQIQQSIHRPLTIISAPAGSGKTTLLSLWRQQYHHPVVWLSLEATDNSPDRFLPYLIAAFQKLNPQLGVKALSLLFAPYPPSPETVLSLLINDLMELKDEDIVLVLDDYHNITIPSLQKAMAFFLEHLPPHLHLVLLTRKDPPLPLMLLRARGQLSEIRTSDLRFTSEEVQNFLQTVMGLDLAPEIREIIERRTEGWAVGLQLAALSLKGRSDVSQFVEGFSGTHGFILDYLSQEVLLRQNPSMQKFLLHTSILDRLHGSLCDAVTGQTGGQTTLEKLEKANLFVSPLDEKHEWYRYHHLFAQALQSILQRQEASIIPTLHRRASEWFEQHNLPTEAIRHAFAIPDKERAVRLIEPVVVPFTFLGQRSLVHEWLNALPEDIIKRRPLLSAYYASLLVFSNQFDKAEVYLSNAEQGLEAEKSDEQTRLIRGYILRSRASIAFFSGNLPQSITLSRQALAILPETEVIARAGMLSNAIHGYLMNGDATQAAIQAVNDAIAILRTTTNHFATASALALLAQLYMLQGRLKQMESTYIDMMEMVQSPEMLDAIFSGPHYYFGLGNLYREWNNFEKAEELLQQGRAIIHNDLPLAAWVALEGFTALASLYQAQGRIIEARNVLNDLQQFALKRHFFFQVQVAAGRALFELRRGNLTDAAQWADQCGLSFHDAVLTYDRENEYLIFARIALAREQGLPTQHTIEEVFFLLDRLLKDAEAKVRIKSIVEIFVIRTLAFVAQGDQEAALSTLKQALDLAEPAGFIRLFVDEGPVIFRLLHQLQERGFPAHYITTLPDYIATLLHAFPELSTSNAHA